MKSHLAIDIGAESGRAILGGIVEGRIQIEEIHRFSNRPLRENDSIRWDIDSIVANVQDSIRRAGPELESVGVDTWAVDYVLLDESMQRLENPRHYRDPRTTGVMEAAESKTTRAEIYDQTGIQFLPFNTLYQLITTDPSVLAKARHFLTIPDYINFLVSGGKALACEFTNATTTQCFNPKTNDWATELLDAHAIPRRIFPKICRPGDVLSVVDNTMVKLIAVAAHDTGSAVAGIPFEGHPSKAAWISSGTWSIMGIEVDRPIISAESLAANFTNEGGVNHTFRFSKNVAGMWLVQQCRAAWGDVDSYAELTALAATCEPSAEYIDPDDPEFFSPGDMPAKINAKLSVKTDGKGQIIRTVLESLAQRYARVLKDAERLSGHTTERIHIVGGGSENDLLNQLTADACRREVFAGPVEATALGNLAMQLVATGKLNSISEARELIRHSFPVRVFKPCP